MAKDKKETIIKEETAVDTVDAESCDTCNDFVAEMTQKLEDCEQKLAIAQVIAEKEKMRADEMSNLVGRTQADFDNFRKRNAEQSKRLKDDGVVAVIEKLIPTLDVMEQAIAMLADEKVAEGVKMIYRQQMAMLTSFGISEIPSLNEPFDPNLHNAILCVEAENEESSNTVVEVFQKGYRMGERIIRHSVVKVAQ